jgi:hypothetical protein
MTAGWRWMGMRMCGAGARFEVCGYAAFLQNAKNVFGRIFLVLK